ncbi:hypothetical protein GIV20_26675, partial [Pseudomonas tremae]|nr:hypothetical protein [Pseudomonas tremae]MCF5811584.1 hypothetical protein [Pseudomonas tremae]
PGQFQNLTLRRAAGEFEVVLFNRFYHWQSRLLHQHLASALVTCNDLQSKWPRPAIIAFFDRD